MDDGRGELVAIAGEAVTLLERELARGRRRIELPEIEGSPRTSATAALPTPATAAPAADTATTLSLPGFEPPAPAPAAAVRAPMPAPVRLAPRSDLPGTLAEVKALVDTCRLCPLCETRTRTVFSDGTDKARLMFVGEAPGRDEDLQGVPFVGRAG